MSAAGQRSAEPSRESPPYLRWNVRWRVVLSFLLAFHVVATFVGPWSGPEPSSRLAQQLAARISPYLLSLHLNHGYRFFAPNPGPSHLVRFEVERVDGTVVAGRFPDPAQHWPRLLYHRYFMVSESAHALSERVRVLSEQLATPPQSQDGQPVPAEVLELYQQDLQVLEQARRRADALLVGIARELAQRHQGQRVRLFLVRHLIADPRDVLSGLPLDDEQLFIERPLIDWTRPES